jgi:uncharacterized protein (DUF2249 family)
LGGDPNSRNDQEEFMTTPSEQDPILASWKISEVLQKHPQVLDVLIDAAPAFSKLRNPLMRKVQSRLVTVAQAAGMAGIEPAALTRKLNQAAGITPGEASADILAVHPQKESAPPPWVETAPVIAEIDARPLMAKGEEPFNAIMKTAKDIPSGSVFRLIVGFEPLPLYDALAKQGFAHFAVDSDGAWTVLFYRLPGAVVKTPAAHKTANLPPLDWDSHASAEVTIDVSELVPPEPMVKILQTLETLPANGRLLVHHVRRPIHLYDRLNEMGYAHDTRELKPGQVEVLIQKPESASTAS